MRQKRPKGVNTEAPLPCRSPRCALKQDDTNIGAYSETSGIFLASFVCPFHNRNTRGVYSYNEAHKRLIDD
jgi:hypothetical protein